MRNYEITITGTTPLLMHHDDIDWADTMESWKNDKSNKKSSKAGDDRTPSWRWIGNLYRGDNGLIQIPTDNIMRAIMEGAANVLVPGGKSGKTFKSQSQSGILPNDVGWPLLSNGSPIKFADIEPLMKEPDFNEHKAAVNKLGFSLFMKRARIGQAKHVRVRPRFDNWGATGTLTVIDEQITDSVLSDFFEVAGKYKGLCDWRPSSKTPGTYGMFSAVVRRV